MYFWKEERKHVILTVPTFLIGFPNNPAFQLIFFTLEKKSCSGRFKYIIIITWLLVVVLCVTDKIAYNCKINIQYDAFNKISLVCCQISCHSCGCTLSAVLEQNVTATVYFSRFPVEPLEGRTGNMINLCVVKCHWLLF